MGRKRVLHGDRPGWSNLTQRLTRSRYPLWGSSTSKRTSRSPP